MEYDPDIFDAVEFGDLESVKMYWTNDINIDFQDGDGISLIMLAARYNHKEIVNYLLDFNPNLSLRSNKRKTVFQIAEQLEDKDILKRLVEFDNQ